MSYPAGLRGIPLPESGPPEAHTQQSIVYEIVTALKGGNLYKRNIPIGCQGNGCYLGNITLYKSNGCLGNRLSQYFLLRLTGSVLP